jgi:hypothetical protein
MRDWFRWTAVAAAAALLIAGTGSAPQSVVPQPVGMKAAADPLPPPNPCDTDAARRYVAGGDAVVFGSTNDSGEEVDDDERYSEQLLTKLQESPGPWCLYNTAKNPTNSDQYMVDGNPTQQAIAHDLRPRLITLTLGRQNSTIVDHVVKCFKNVKDHDFLEANVCALTVLNGNHWDELIDDLSEILNRYMVQMDGNPRLVVAVTGYFNPYNSATSVASEVPGFCAKLQDTIPTCTIRWLMLPPALVTLDQVVKKLNETIKYVVDKFTWTSQGRFFFINPYDKFKDHCMKMEVEIKTKVYHPPNTVHDHNSKNDFGCDEPWIASDGEKGQKSPFPYLTPAVTGVLILATQTTEGMGIYPNAKGHQCFADLIWQATKERLGIPEAPEEACTDV